MCALHAFLFWMQLSLARATFPSSCTFIIYALLSKIGFFLKIGLRPTHTKIWSASWLLQWFARKYDDLCWRAPKSLVYALNEWYLGGVRCLNGGRGFHTRSINLPPCRGWNERVWTQWYFWQMPYRPIRMGRACGTSWSCAYPPSIGEWF